MKFLKLRYLNGQEVLINPNVVMFATRDDLDERAFTKIEMIGNTIKLVEETLDEIQSQMDDGSISNG